ncbi:tyrosine-type recombinase/integrase [Planktomarina sp.]|nr:tyrosine-type recombinase/integrase [Planktomarina sp.]MDB4842142.1 tyrosine-type recombinase/integrase [Planktomarina sp.]
MPEHNIPFLTVTAKGGWYGYRRRIPKRVRHLFNNKSEWIKSFKTRNLDIAQLELRKMNEWYEHKIVSNGGAVKIKGQLPREQIRTVVTDLFETGLHPDDQPEINVHSKPEEISKLLNDTLEVQLLQIQFQKGKISIIELKEKVAALNLENTALYKLKKFGSERRKLKESLSYKYLDIERMNADSIDPNIDCDANDYVPPQLKWDESDPEVIRYRVMCGENLLPDPTWQNALDDYLKRNLKNKLRNPEQKQKHETATVSLAEKLATAFPKGMDTPMKDIEQFMIENFAEAVWANISTRVRNLRTLRAVWRSWDRNNQRQKVGFDPFVAVVQDNQGLIKLHERNRRSFTPEEFQHFRASILDEPNKEIKLIGLIMAYCGAPTGEAGGLQRQDIMVSGAIPYIWFRDHKDRIMGKKRIQRIVPLIDPLLELLSEYLSTVELNKDDPIFPSYGVGKHSSSERSKKLHKHIVNMRQDFDDSQLSPYSLRHTFKDRAVMARVPNQVTEYLMGHRTEQSSKVHDDYGTGLPAKALVKWMTAIQEVQDHGHFHGDE